VRDVTTYSLRKGNPDKTRADVVVVGVAQRGKGSGKGPVVAPGGEAVEKAYGRRFAPLLSSMGVTGSSGEVVRVPTGGAITSSMLVLVGMGDRDKLTTEKVRRAAGVAARNVGNAASVALALPAADAEHVRAVADGFLSGSYTFVGRRSGARKKPVSEVAILSEAARRKDCIDALAAAQVVAKCADRARDWVNLPANQLYPSDFAEAVQAIDRSKKPAVQVTVLDEAQLAELGCGGILGVGLGSDNPPRLVKLEYRPADAVGHVALVGKGITYDSGGLTIKPGGSMATMKCDMAGAAAVVAATYAVAELGIPVSVTAFAPLAENMVSGHAMRPGDVLTMYGGKTVEVLNTDAEGRLVLADALVLATEEDPDAIVNVATLTGPCVVALGDRIAGVFGDDATVAAVQSAAETTGELMWRLPIPDETRERIRSESKVADLLQHNWVRWGSALWAAGFLQEFVDGRPFAHLDIAGPAYNTGGPWGHVPSGGTGYSIATLVEYVAALARSGSAPTGSDD
jgi:leucyl aminopeptidase